MNDQTCRSCPQPVRDVFLCNACTRKTRRHLANQAAYLADLETELARMSHKQPPSEGGRSAEIPLPYSPIAGDLIAEQRNLLTSWVRLCYDEHILAECPADTVPSLASWLIVALPVMRKHLAAGEFRAEIRALAARIVKCIDLPEYRQRTVVGHCPESYTDEHGMMEHCPGEIEMGIPHDRDLPGWLRCKTCQIEWPPGPQWTKAGIRILARDAELKRQSDLARSFARMVA